MKIVITGGGSGLGADIIDALFALRTSTLKMDIYNLDLIANNHPDVTNVKCDVRNAQDIAEARFKLPNVIDVLVNNAAVNEVNFIEDLEESNWDKVMNVNAKGIFLTVKGLLLNLHYGTILNIVSNAAFTPMTSSLVYNASKGAAHIMTLQMARELMPRYGITVFGIGPNKLKGTKMSSYIEQRVLETRGWTAEYAKEYQLKALPAGEETDPKMLAEFIAFLLSSKERHKYLAGTILPYGK
jgi:NAD(P)-dependent dehydrogenase (short-subunit alcohol dehydrogenase family)